MRIYIKPDLKIKHFNKYVALDESGLVGTYSAYQLNEVMFGNEVNANNTRTVKLQSVNVIND